MPSPCGWARKPTPTTPKAGSRPSILSPPSPSTTSAPPSPLFAALKRDGRPLYQLARAGIEVEIQPRPVTVIDIDILAWRSPDLSLRLTTSPGFYVRSLAHDLGQALGCGGHVAALRRLASGDWRAEDAISLDELAAAGERWPAFLHGLPAALAMLPAVVLPPALAQRFALGQPVALGPLPAAASEYRVFGAPERFLGIGRADPEHGLLLPYKIFAAPLLREDLSREGREESQGKE
jgi:tRNA pseudouridine55 synthase